MFSAQVFANEICTLYILYMTLAAQPLVDHLHTYPVIPMLSIFNGFSHEAMMAALFTNTTVQRTFLPLCFFIY